MDLKELWISLFGTTEIFGIDMGFWVGTAVVALIVVAMNVVFWSFAKKDS